jgi:hypothetical protein
LENIKKENMMRTKSVVIVCLPVLAAFFCLAAVTEEMGPKMKKLVDNRVRIVERVAADPIIIKAVREQNQVDMSLDEIKRIDEQWQAGEKDDFALDLQKNTAGKFLRKKLLSNKMVYTEAFLCDMRGAVVGEYPKTSDYWQGDEEKFTACFNSGDGKVFIGELEADASSQSYSVQISAPVKDEGKTIGVLVMGIRNIK